MSLLEIQISQGDSANFVKNRIVATDAREMLVRLAGHLEAIAAGVTLGANVVVRESPVRASGTVTFTDVPTANDTVTVNGVDFTAKASGATGNQFNIGGGADAAAKAAATATNLAAAINASTTAKVKDVVQASASAGVVTVTAKQAGLGGNVFTLTESADNCEVAAIAGGTDGTRYALNLGQAAQ
jgi:hypothetical protein